MADKPRAGCARPTGGLVGQPEPAQDEQPKSASREGTRMIQVGRPAPDFVSPAYGVYDEDAGVENRGRFLIDPDGIVLGFEVLTPPIGRVEDEDGPAVICECT